MRLGADGFDVRAARPAAALVAGALLLGAVLCGGLAGGVRPSHLAAAGAAAAGQVNDAPPAQGDEPVIAGQMVFSNRVLRRGLERAVRSLEEGRTDDGLTQLQAVLDAPSDSFVESDDRQRSSVRSEALRVLGSLDRSARRVYEEHVAPESRPLLARARGADDPALFAEIVRRFYFTAEGFAAADWLASRWLDQGQPAVAARLWSALIREPAHQGRVTPTLLAKAALAERLSGESQIAAPVAQGLQGRTVALGGEPLAALDWAAQQTAARPAEAEPERWLTPLGSAAGNRAVAASTPLLQPIWSASFYGSDNAALRGMVVEWEMQQRSAPEPAAVAALPLVLGNLVVVRDLDGLRAVDRRSGQTRWTYACETSLAQAHTKMGAALDIGRAYASNANQGQLSSDGERIYAVDCVDLAHAPTNNNAPPALIRSRRGRLLLRGSNCLIALPVEPAAGATTMSKPLWTAGGVAEGASQRDRLTGHFFFGPPLPLDGRLYALTEHERQLNLVVLDPKTGELVGMQELAFADESVENDGDRAVSAAAPSFADGILVCPTETGLLIGVDLVTRRLLWSYFYGEVASSTGRHRWPVPLQTLHGHAAFADPPHIHRQRIVYLPRLSNEIHCLDLATGEKLWTVPRDDAEYIGTVTDETVVVIGSRACRGLSLETGRPQWSAVLGLPAGRGVPAGSQYLVPLQEGRVAALEIATGEEVGLTRLLPARGDAADFEPASDQWEFRPGNLVAVGDVILSVGPHGMTAFPQSAALLDDMRDRLAGTPRIDDLVLATELELNLGHVAAARKSLAAAMDSKEDGADRRRAEELLRELLYADLRQERADQATILAQLEPLATTPREQARLLAATAEYHLRGGRPQAAFAAARAFIDLPISRPLPVTGDRSHLISPEAWAEGFIGRLRQRFGPPELARIDMQVERDRQAALAADGTDALERFLAIYGSWPQAAAIRAELADRLAARGEYQRAELLLLINRRSQDSSVVTEALCQLARLWDHLGQFAQAAEVLDELRTQRADVAVAEGQTGAEFAAAYQADPLTVAAGRRHRVDQPPERVEITETRWWWNEPEAMDLVRGYRRYYNLPADMPYHLLEAADAPAGRLSVIDKETGRTTGSIQLPSAVSFASEAREACVGHFLPLGGPGTLYGVSLLELDRQSPLWTIPLPGSAAQSDIKVGPAGTTFCAFQLRQQLIVADPSTGRIRWQRHNLTPDCGLYIDSAVGLFGDEEVLVLFDDDQTSYTVYRTATGEELRRGSLPLDTHQPRRVFGRRLFYIHSTPDGQRMRIWDPLSDRTVLDRPVGPFLIHNETVDGELVVAVGAGQRWDRLLILDVLSGTVRLDMPLTREQTTNLNYVRAFRDRERYFVNFQRNVGNGMRRGLRRAGRPHTFINNHVLTATHMEGDLYAVSRATGEILWKRDIEHRSFLHLPRVQMPFLVAASQLGETWPPNRGAKPSLLVEAIDPATGRTLALDDRLLYDRLVRCTYDAETRRVELHGLRIVVTLDYSRPAAHIPLEDEPL